ncbi:MAG: D-alanine--D-alanine ligase [Spirochaetales bacterium]|nr:D-alanine--D-alanine ligase [Spirochaetales bacterium]
MERIALLYGGKTGEHEVSCRSAASVAENIDKDRFEVVFIGIGRDGIWYLQREEKRDGMFLVIEETDPVSVLPGKGLFARGKDLSISCVFPVLHGPFGEDGTVQGLLDITGLPYVGGGVLGSSLGMDKGVIKKLWMGENLSVVPFLSLERWEYMAETFSTEDYYRKARESFPHSLIIKPARAGSSVGVSKANSLGEFKNALQKAFQFDDVTLIEPFITAREIECAVLGNNHPVSFPPGEILPSHDFYDYDAKYIDPDGAALEVPAKLPENIISEIRDTAVKAFQTARISGMARVDFFVDPDKGLVLLNEINTIPGFTNISMYSRMCEAGGVSYPELITKLIDLAYTRKKDQDRIDYFSH